jgi:hypothetical protein
VSGVVTFIHHGVLRRSTPRAPREGREALDRVTPGTFRLVQRVAVPMGLLSGVLAFVGATTPRKSDPRSAVSEIVGPHSESVLLTPTAPPGPRWIEVSRWEDLVKASRFMGRPILRLYDGTRTPEQSLFYVPDGPQSYVFDFQRTGLRPSTSGGYSLSPAPETTVAEPTPVPVAPRPPERRELPAIDEPTLPEPSLGGEVASVPLPPEEPTSVDEVVEEYLGPEVDETAGEEGLPAKNRVEQEIRGMIHDVLVKMRGLPAGSHRLEEASYHVQRGLELLRQGRYGSAQIEVNRATRLVHERPRH